MLVITAPPTMVVNPVPFASVTLVAPRVAVAGILKSAERAGVIPRVLPEVDVAGMSGELRLRLVSVARVDSETITLYWRPRGRNSGLELRKLNV